MNDLGYTGNAIICVTHSFPCKNEHLDIAAEWSIVPDYMESRLIEILNENSDYDLYNKVITLCDALADAEGFTTLEKDWFQLVYVMAQPLILLYIGRDSMQLRKN